MREGYLEISNRDYCRILAPQKILFSKKSDYQQIDVAQMRNGLALFLDGVIQFYEEDEFIYHEMAAHFPLAFHPKPQKALVLGGGDGLILRELLKYPSIKKIVLVDIDKEVIEVSKKYFSHLHRNSFDNPKVEVRIEDALNYVEETEEKFDMIFMDLVDPFGFGEKLYTESAIKKMSRPLAEEGIFATHAEDAFPENYTALKLFARLKKYFKYGKLATTYISSFDGEWGFVALSNKPLQPVKQSIETRFFEFEKLDYYTSLPPYLKEKLEEFEKEGFSSLSNFKPISERIAVPQEIEERLKEIEKS